MKYLSFFLIALLLCVSCQQPSDNAPPTITGIELKTGTRYCVEKGTSEPAPAILVKYSDGSSVEAVGSVSSTESGFADITYEGFKIEDGAYIYDEALSELPDTLGEEYDSKYVLLKAKDGGHKIEEAIYEDGRSAALSITAKDLYILGEDGAEISVEIINMTRVIDVKNGSVTLDGIKFTSVFKRNIAENEVSLIVANAGQAFVKNCDFTGYNVVSLIDQKPNTCWIAIYSEKGGTLSLTNNVFKEMFVFEQTEEQDVIKNNVFKNAYVCLLYPDNIVEGNVFENDSLGYGAICVDGVFNETTKAYLESKNKNCTVVQLVE